MSASSRGLGSTMKTKSNPCKQSLYFPEEMLEEIRAEAERQDRTLSWLMQKAWKIAREKIRRAPADVDVG